MTTWVNSQHSRWRIFDTDPGVGNTNNAVESFNRHFKEKFLNSRKYALDELVKIIVLIVLFHQRLHLQDHLFS